MGAYTYTYTETRLEIISYQFQVALSYAGLSHEAVDKIVNAVENQELEAVGIYIESGNFRKAEMEINVDWNKHNSNLKIHGEYFDTDLPGWKDRGSPEVDVMARNFANIAKKRGYQLRTWIRVSDKVRKDSSYYKRVCDRLGYSYGSSVAPWENENNLREMKQVVIDLDEVNLFFRKG